MSAQVSETAKKRLITLNVGPQHPATHGVLRMKMLLDGEIIQDVEPIIGYLHRGSEKLGEMGTYLQFIPYMDRMDYVAAIHNNAAYVIPCEKLGNVEVPERANVLRVLAMETNRICSHLLWLGTWGLDLGALTPFFWCFREREKGIRLLERMTGTRLTYSYFRFGGVHNDIDANWTRDCIAWLADVRKTIVELEELLTANDIFVARTKKVGRIAGERAIAYGMTGPNLRASGVDLDLRKVEPYSAYETYDFKVPTRTEGDCYARYVVRMEEMEQSCVILEQACARHAESKGGYVSAKVGEKAKQFRWHPPAGECYARIESPRGELGCLIISDDSTRPYRVKVRAHSFSNLSAIAEMSRGQLIQDVIVTLGSIDIVLGDIDR